MTQIRNNEPYARIRNPESLEAQNFSFQTEHNRRDAAPDTAQIQNHLWGALLQVCIADTAQIQDHLWGTLLQVCIDDTARYRIIFGEHYYRSV